MTNGEINELRKVVIAFRRSPCPTTADSLLKLLAPHRDNNNIQRLIDEVLDYKFTVGSLSAPEAEVAAGLVRSLSPTRGATL